MRAGLLCLAACLLFGAAAAGEQGGGPLLVEAKQKPPDEWKKYPTRTIDQLAGFDMNTTCGALSPYGGLLAGRVKATGFFRTEKIGDRWWLIDPDGCRFIHVGVVSVRMGSSTGSREALRERFGSEEKWAGQTAELLAGSGFNGTGGWSDAQALGKAPRRLVYTVMHSFMSAYGQKRGGTFRQPGHTGYPND